MKRAAIDFVSAIEHAIRGPADARIESLSTVREFLFLQYETALGTSVHATPVFEALRQAVPNATISVACSKIVHAVLQNNPYIDSLIPTPDPYTRFFSAALVLRRAAAIGRDAPRCIITTTGSSRIKTALLAVITGKGSRVGFTPAPRLYCRALAKDPSISHIDNNLKIVEALGHAYHPYEPRVFFSRDDLVEAEGLLAETGLANDRPRAVFATQVSGGQPTQWREDRFVAVANYLAGIHGCGLIFVGTASEAAAIDRLRSRIAYPTTSLAGKTSIAALSAVLCQADIAIALDTGTMHVARSAMLPTVIIAPAWQPAIEWLPRAQDRFIVLRGSDISTIPPDYAIDEVAVEHVKSAADQLLNRFMPSSAARAERLRRAMSSRRPNVL